MLHPAGISSSVLTADMGESESHRTPARWLDPLPNDAGDKYRFGVAQCTGRQQPLQASASEAGGTTDAVSIEWHAAHRCTKSVLRAAVGRPVVQPC